MTAILKYKNKNKSRNHEISNEIEAPRSRDCLSMFGCQTVNMVKVNPKRKSKDNRGHPGAMEPEKAGDGVVSSPRPSTSRDVEIDGLNNRIFDPKLAGPDKADTMALVAAEGRTSSLASYTIPKRSAVQGLDDPSDTDSFREDSFSGSDENFELSVHADDSGGDDDVLDVTDVRSTSGHRHDPEADQQLQDGDFAMFDPVAVARPKSDVLTRQQEAFLDKFFTTVVADDDVESSILGECPVPTLDVLTQRKLDPDILDLIPKFQQKSVTRTDGGFLTINRRIKFALGPLAQVWKELSGKRRAAMSQNEARQNEGSVDVNRLLKHVEQTVVCLGQASQTVDFQRRQQSVGAVC